MTKRMNLNSQNLEEAEEKVRIIRLQNHPNTTCCLDGQIREDEKHFLGYSGEKGGEPQRVSGSWRKKIEDSRQRRAIEA